MVHKIHIPVMGICYTADTPIRVSHFGITSVISLVDDGLLEKYRMAYGERLGVDVGSPQTTRIGRIRSYLDFVVDESARKFDWIRGLRFARCVGDGRVPCAGLSPCGLNDKDRYFMMLPADSPLRQEYEYVCGLSGLSRVSAEMELTRKMEAGEIQANIMVSLNYDDAALDAVRGFAASKVRGSLVLSAGVNLGVFDEIARHECFFRRGASAADRQRGAYDFNAPQKRIILKVSDFRSALVQSRYLAKKGLEVYEYRIESGVNCGGHAFCEGGRLLPDVLKEFISRKDELFEAVRREIVKLSEIRKLQSCMGDSDEKKPSRITVQGGLCTAGEIRDVLSLGADGVGVATPFLLVPQATSCDADTRRMLASATESDVKLTHASPLGIPFMNLTTSTGAETCRRKAFAYFGSRDEPPGFPCLQHYLAKPLPGFSHPVCMASREYVLHRLAEIDDEETAEVNALKLVDLGDAKLAGGTAFVSSGSCVEIDSIRKKYDVLRRETLSRECICRFLGNAGREELREKSPTCNYEREKLAVSRGLQTARVREPVTVCPGPGIAYFNRTYTLLEMMQHLYGTGDSLTPADKIHAFDLERRIMRENLSILSSF